SRTGSRPTPCDTVLQRPCSREAPTSVPCRRCSATPTSQPPKFTPTWIESTCDRYTSSTILADNESLSNASVVGQWADGFAVPASSERLRQLSPGAAESSTHATGIAI